MARSVRADDRHRDVAKAAMPLGNGQQSPKVETPFARQQREHDELLARAAAGPLTGHATYPAAADVFGPRKNVPTFGSQDVTDKHRAGTAAGLRDAEPLSFRSTAGHTNFAGTAAGHRNRTLKTTAGMGYLATAQQVRDDVTASSKSHLDFTAVGGPPFREQLKAATAAGSAAVDRLNVTASGVRSGPRVGATTPGANGDPFGPQTLVGPPAVTNHVGPHAARDLTERAAPSFASARTNSGPRGTSAGPADFLNSPHTAAALRTVAEGLRAALPNPIDVQVGAATGLRAFTTAELNASRTAGVFPGLTALAETVSAARPFNGISDQGTGVRDGPGNAAAGALSPVLRAVESVAASLPRASDLPYTDFQGLFAGHPSLYDPRLDAGLRGTSSAIQTFAGQLDALYDPRLDAGLRAASSAIQTFARHEAFAAANYDALRALRRNVDWMPKVNPLTAAFLLERSALSDDDEMAYLVQGLPPRSGLALLRLATHQGREVAYELIASAVTLDAVIESFEDAIKTAPHLTENDRETLGERLRAVKDKRWTVAVRALLCDVEGPVRHIALGEDLIVQGSKWQRATKKNPAKAHGPEMKSIADVLRQYDFARPQQRFHTAYAFGGRGNEIRHSTGPDPDAAEAKKHIAFALVVLADVLEYAGAPEPREAIRRSIHTMAARVPLVP